MCVYGAAGNCETNSIDSFKWGVADRGASIRIPRFTARYGAKRQSASERGGERESKRVRGTRADRQREWEREEEEDARERDRAWVPAAPWAK